MAATYTRREVSPVREALGRAHYERMRMAMLPDLVIDPWERLKPKSREAYRRKLDYLVPALAALLIQQRDTVEGERAS